MIYVIYFFPCKNTYVYIYIYTYVEICVYRVMYTYMSINIYIYEVSIPQSLWFAASTSDLSTWTPGVRSFVAFSTGFVAKFYMCYHMSFHPEGRSLLGSMSACYNLARTHAKRNYVRASYQSVFCRIGKSPLRSVVPDTSSHRL